VATRSAAAEPPSDDPTDSLAFPATDSRPIAITGVRVVVAPGKVLEQATLVVRNGRVAAVGTGLTPPPDAIVRPATGRIIYPGFIDAYSTPSGEPSLPTLATPAEVATGVPATSDNATSDNATSDNAAASDVADRGAASETVGAASGGGRAAVHPLIRPATDARSLLASTPERHALFRSQGFVARLAAPSAGIIRGTSVLVATEDSERASSLLATRVALHAHLYVPRSPRRTFYPNSPMGAVALARQTFVDAQWLRELSLARARRSPTAAAANSAAQNTTAQNAIAQNPAARNTTAQNAIAQNPVAQDPMVQDPAAVFPLAWRETHQRLWPFLPPSSAQADAVPAKNTGAAANPELRATMDQGWVMFDVETEQYLLRAEQFSREFGLRAMFRGGGREYRRAAEIAATGRPLILPLAFPAPPRVDTAETEINAELDDLMHWRLAPENPARMERAGSRIALTTHGLTSPKDFLPALRKAVKRGWSADSALRALTTTPAELFGVGHELGTLEPGKWASFSIADADLFTGGGRILETWIAGRRREVLDDFPLRLAGLWRLELEPAFADRAVLTMRLGRRRTSSRHVEGQADEALADDALSDDALSDDALSDAALSDAALSDAALSDAALDDAALDDEELTGTLVLPQTRPVAEVVLERLVAARGRLTASFPCRSFGVEGVATLSLHWAGAASTPRLDGVIAWPNGRQSEVVARPDRSAIAAPSRTRAAQSASLPVAGLDAIAVNYPLGAWGRAASGPPPQPESVVFRGGTVWTCGPAGVIADADVWVARGRIMAVGQRLSVPANSLEVPLAGRHLTPGLIDSHSHIATDGGVNETGQALTCQVRIGDFIDANDVNLYRQLAGGTTAALILHGSANPVGGQGEAIKFRWGLPADGLRFVEAPPTVKFALGENVTTGPDILAPRFPQTRMGVEQFHRQALRAARDYRERWRAWRERPTGPRPRRDLALECLAETLDGRRWIHCHAYRHDETRTLLEVLEDFQIRIGCLHHITDGYLMADAILRHQAMVATFTDWWGFKVEALDAVAHNGAFLHRAGIVTSFHSDDRELGRHLNGEAAKAMRYGDLPPAEALKMVTIAPAKQLRVETHVGSLEAGKHADLVLWSGPPLAPETRCEQTWIDGRKYFDRQDDLRQRMEVERLKAVLVQAVLASGEPMMEAGVDYTTDKEAWDRVDRACRSASGRVRRQEQRGGR
jgi:N-acetylglucosamine-6-phosphate deacetylase